jgi:hypothetical protein
LRSSDSERFSHFWMGHSIILWNETYE